MQPAQTSLWHFHFLLSWFGQKSVPTKMDFAFLPSQKKHKRESNCKRTRDQQLVTETNAIHYKKTKTQVEQLSDKSHLDPSASLGTMEPK